MKKIAGLGSLVVMLVFLIAAFPFSITADFGVHSNAALADSATYTVSYKVAPGAPDNPWCTDSGCSGGVYSTRDEAYAAASDYYWQTCPGGVWPYCWNGDFCLNSCTWQYVLSGSPNLAFMWPVDHPEYVTRILTGTQDLGSSGSSGVQDADESNFERAPFCNIPSNTEEVGSSVNFKSGNLYHSQQVGPLTFSYNSLDSTSGPLGTGWTHELNLSVISNSDGSLYLKGGDGNRTWFSAGSANVYYADLKSRDSSSIIENTDGSFTRRTKYGKTYNFDSSGRLVGIVDRNGNATTLTYTGSDLTGITDATGRTIAIGVSGGKITSIKDFSGNTYSIAYEVATGLLSSITDPLQNTWSYRYDANGRMAQKTDPSGNATSYTYNSSGMLSQVSDPDGKTRQISYNAAGNSASMTEPDGGVWTRTYDSVFNVPLAITDPYGNKTTYTYDSENHLLSKTYPDGTSESFTYDSNGNTTSRTDTGGNKTTLTYNAQNRIETITDPNGGVTSISYDGNGNLSSYKDPTGALTLIQRDLAGSSAPFKGSITSTTDPLGNTASYGYDQFNNVSSVTDPSGATWNFTHDLSGNVLSRTDPDGSTATFTYNANGELTDAVDALGNATSLGYDANGNLNLSTDPLNHTTTYTYNFRGQPLTRKDALGGTVSFSYGETGCSTCGGGSGKLTSLTDQTGSKTLFSYDLRGLPTGETDPLGNRASLAWSSMGRLSGKTDKNGQTITYTYDGAGNLTQATYPDGSGVSNSFDGLGRLTRMQDLLGTSTFTYDGAGRLTGSTDPEGFGTSYEYDANGNLKKLTYPGGSPVAYVEYTYDPLNRLSSATLTTNTNTQYQATYEYADNVNLTAYIRFNGIKTTYSHDNANRFTGITDTGSSGQLILSYRFILDGMGKVTHSLETEPSLPVSISPNTTAYTYDSKGVRLTQAGPSSFNYDNEGQLQETAKSSESTTYTFDCRHRLISIGADTQFDYDGLGRRLGVTRGSVTTRYIYDPYGNLLAEADGSNNITRAYVYGLGLSALVDSNGTIYCYHFNATGSTTALTDMSQNVVNEYAYDPFGAILNQQETVPQPFKFVGRYGVMAEPNGLYYMRARYYDPGVGRFISEDPLGFGGGDTNLYGYVQNDPINRVDPYGLSDAGMISYEGRVFIPYGTTPVLSITYDSQGNLYQDGVPIEITRGEIPIGGFTRHALNQAISRDCVGVADRAILDAVKNPTKIVEQAEGAMKYIGKDATVILNRAREVITTWARNSNGWRIR